jgi:hypothetical protein
MHHFPEDNLQYVGQDWTHIHCYRGCLLGGFCLGINPAGKILLGKISVLILKKAGKQGPKIRGIIFATRIFPDRSSPGTWFCGKKAHTNPWSGRAILLFDDQHIGTIGTLLHNWCQAPIFFLIFGPYVAIGGYR